MVEGPGRLGCWGDRTLTRGQGSHGQGPPLCHGAGPGSPHCLRLDPPHNPPHSCLPGGDCSHGKGMGSGGRAEAWTHTSEEAGSQRQGLESQTLSLIQWDELNKVAKSRDEKQEAD